eukprot:gene10699-biopygen12367
MLHVDQEYRGRVDVVRGKRQWRGEGPGRARRAGVCRRLLALVLGTGAAGSAAARGTRARWRMMIELRPLLSDAMAGAGTADDG